MNSQAANAPVIAPRKRGAGWRTWLVTGAAIVLYGCAAVAWLPEGAWMANPRWLPLSYPAFFLRTFALHIAVVLTVTAVAAWLTRRRRWALTLLPLVVLGSAGRVRDYVPLRAAPTGPTLRVMMLNVRGNNPQLKRVIEEVKRVRPDVLCLVEYDQACHAQLGPPLEQMFPHHVVGAVTAQGTAIYARQAFKAVERLEISTHDGPQFRVEMEHAGRALALYGVHLEAPESTGHFLRQRREVAELLLTVDAEPLPTILCGDFNFTNDSAAADALAARGLVDVNRIRGAGPQLTWKCLVRRWRWLPRLRIDHVFLSAGLTCRTPEVGQDSGSDHRAVVADVGWEHVESEH